MNDSFTDNDLLAELTALGPQPRRPGGVTAAELAERKGISSATALRFLKGQVLAGRLVCQMAILENGRVGYVFYANDSR